MKKSLTFFAVLLSVNAFGQWTTANLPQGKTSMGAVAYGSKVWLGGGSTNTEDTKAVDIYDLSTGEWTVEQLSIPREFAAAGAAGGKVFFAGGINFWTFEHYSRVDIFDTQTHVWTTAELPEEKFDVAAVSYGDRVFFAGGVNLATGVNSAAVDIYNTTTGQWSTASLSEAGAVRAVVSGSKLVFVGASVMDIYDAATDTWTAETLPDARLFSGVTLVGNQIFIAGGMHFDNTPTNRVDIYNLTTGTWTMSSLSAPRGFLNNAVTVCGKAFFAGGGTFDLNTNAWVSASNRVDIFDPATGEWTIDQISHPVVNHSVVANGNHVLIAGGAENDVAISAVDIYSCGGVVSEVWQEKILPLTEPQFGLFIDVPTSNVAWMATEGGDFSQCPWIFNTEQNTFCKTTDGENWTCGTYPNSGSSILTAISAIDANRAYFSLYDFAFASGSKIIKTIDGGQTWTEENVQFSVWLEFVHAFNSDLAVGVGDPDTLGFDIRLILNAQWIRIDPTNPAKIPANIPGEWPWPFHAVEGNNLWCVTNYGRVLHTANTGFTWEAWNGPEQTSPDAIACHGNVCLLTYSACDSLTGDNAFRLWRTADKGLHWENLTPDDNHYTAQQMRYIPGTGVVMAALRGNNATGPFKTIVSYDNGNTWETIDTGTPLMEIGFLNGNTGWATEYEVDGGPTRMFKYVGAPIVSALSEHRPLDAEVSINPNPTTGIVRVKVQGETLGDYLLTVSDAFGRVVHSEMIENQSSFEQSVDLSGVPAGVYVVTLSNGVGSTSLKVVKQ